MSKLLPEQSNLIIIGAWNPAIIQPNWILQEFSDIIAEKEVGVQIVAGAISSFRMEFSNFFLDPNGGRLVFIPKNFENNTLEIISKLALGIRDKLKYTPITAADCNFAFNLEQGETFALDDIAEEEQIRSLYSNFQKDFDLIGRGIRHTFAGADFRINLNYDYTDEGNQLRVNFDYQNPFALDPMKSAAEKFITNQAEAKVIFESLVKRKSS